MALPKETRPPSAVMTCRPSRRLPGVARHAELSKNAQYSHEPTARMRMKQTPVKVLRVPGIDAEPASEATQQNVNGEGQQQGSQRLDADIDGPGHTRSQNPAYSVLSVRSGTTLKRGLATADGEAGSASKSPQKRQNFPSGKRRLPQLAHSSSSTVSIGCEYYARAASL